MNTVRFVKSFSKGQITIPKEFRDVLGIVNEFWLKLYLENGKIIAEPVEKETSPTAYLKTLEGIKGDWFSLNEYKETRKGVEDRLNQSVV